ncbi:hypothetical protein AVEN_243129-1 [Araneus ventricosus]|uniref:RNase H type-1 domain-containing protein n=1 Tax=Araneus ventricosus TaxID=182803 RepID=A0A4Y2P7Z6_ARAVE|nr:hypothetical protein AVEN_243129-1 [Araneus ventricosus]
MARQIRRNKLNKIIDDKISFEYGKRIQPWKTLKIDWNYYMEEIKGLMTFTDGSKMDGRVGYAFIVFYNKTELDYRKFRLNDSSTVFMAEVIAIEQAVQYVKANDLGQVNIISDSKSALMVLSAVEEARDIINNIKEDIKEYKGKITLTWIRAHMWNFGYERADQLAKEATLISDETISFVPSRNLIRNEGNKIIKDLWKNRWNDSKNARWTKNLIDKVNVDRLYGDFYINQISTAHGVFRENQARFFEKTSLCLCDQKTGSVLHVIKECEIWTSYRRNWPSVWQLMSLKDLINNADIRISLRGLLHELLIKELDLFSSFSETDVSRH